VVADDLGVFRVEIGCYDLGVSTAVEHSGFDQFGFFDVECAEADDGGDRGGGEAEADEYADVAPSTLGFDGECESPCDGDGPEAVGEVEDE